METKMDLVAWARGKCEEVIKTCQVVAVDGTVLFTPDGVGHYPALWTRDFAYLLEHGIEFLTQEQAREAVRTLLEGQRQDGAIPDRVNHHLVPFFQPGGITDPVGHGPALDNGMFMVALVYYYHRHFQDAAFVGQAVPALRRALNYIPRHRGLVINDTQQSCSTYGFQDCVGKGGHDLFCSLLWVVACRHMAELDVANDTDWLSCAATTEEALNILWDKSEGAYLAADEVCRQVDVWGNAFAVAHQIGPKDKLAQISEYLRSHYADYIYEGQVRHLPGTQEWERMLRAVSLGTYQNGGYWGTPSGWLIEALMPVDSALARRTFDDLMAFYQREGILEWSSPDGAKGPDLYVATILNVWTLVKQFSK